MKKICLQSDFILTKDVIEWAAKMSENPEFCQTGDIRFVDEKEENPDYYVVINHVDNFKNPEKTILFYIEPWCYSYYQNWGVKTWKKRDDLLQVRDHNLALNLFDWQLPKTITQLRTESIQKTKTISTITSCKFFDPGHVVRIKLIHYLESENFPIDIYGYANNFRFNQYKGCLSSSEKDNGLYPYKYYIQCENNSENNYATEKLWDGILSECVVFYWGCPNIEDYIDSACIIRLHSSNNQRNLQIINEAIENNEWEKRIDRIRVQKRKLLDNFNLFNIVKNVISWKEEKPIDICIRCSEETGFKKIFNQIRCNSLYDRCRTIYVYITGIDRFTIENKKVQVFHLSPFVNETDSKIFLFFKSNHLQNNTNVIFANVCGGDIDLTHWEEFNYDKTPDITQWLWTSNDNNIN
jgi:hypothetical protein